MSSLHGPTNLHVKNDGMFNQVNQKMMLTLTASIMYWHLKRPVEDRAMSSDSENGSSSETVSNSNIDDSASESSTDDTLSR